MTKIEVLAAAAEMIAESSPYDYGAMVVNRDGLVVGFGPARFQTERMGSTLPKVGNSIPPNGSIMTCMRDKKSSTTVTAREKYGVSFKTKTSPVFDETGEVIGAISISTSVDKQDNLHSAAQTIAATTEEMTATIQELGATAALLATEMDKVKAGGETVMDKIKKTDDILKFVSDVAANSNLLGLNAAIEAARAGEHGRGFAVVAEEIRKMAVNSAQSVAEIKKILQGIYDDTTTVVNTIVASSDISARQAIATDEISKTMQAMASTASDLEQIAHDL